MGTVWRSPTTGRRHYHCYSDHHPPRLQSFSVRAWSTSLALTTCCNIVAYKIVERKQHVSICLLRTWYQCWRICTGRHRLGHCKSGPTDRTVTVQPAPSSGQSPLWRTTYYQTTSNIDKPHHYSHSSRFQRLSLKQLLYSLVCNFLKCSKTPKAHDCCTHSGFCLLSTSNTQWRPMLKWLPQENPKVVTHSLGKRPKEHSNKRRSDGLAENHGNPAQKVGASAGHYMRNEDKKSQMPRQAVFQDGASKGLAQDWRKDVHISDRYCAYQTEFISMLTAFQST